MLDFVSIAPAKLLQVLRDRKGVSATEYTLMVVGIAALVLAGARVLGGDISTALNSIGTYLTSAAASI
ncbi:MAG: Flp family type IVb pilin [Acetobacteraceae bacterium]|nr:Flp family type IVb pilin [Pseudomonadota bacterium]